MALVLLIMLFNVSSLSLGKGLGRRVTYLTNNIFETVDLKEYKRILIRNKVDLETLETEEDKLILNFTGVEDVNNFTKKMYSDFPFLKIYEVGTFNSISSVKNSASSLQTYFFLFSLTFVLFWTYRYKVWGLLYSMSILMNIMASIFILNYIGYIFNGFIWFASLFIFGNLYILKNWVIQESYESFNIEKIKKNQLLIAGLMFISSVLLMMIDHVYDSVAIFMFLSSIFLLIDTLSINKLLERFKSTKLSTEKIKNYFTPRESINAPDIVDPNFLISFLTIFLIMVSILSFVGNKDNTKPSRDFSKETYLVVDSSDASDYLEVQAKFGKHNVFDKLKEYKISEEKNTWYVFDETVTYLDMVRVKRTLKETLDLDSDIIVKNGFEFTQTLAVRASIFLGLNLFVFLFLRYLQGVKSVKTYFYMSFLMHVFTFVFMKVYNVALTLEYNIMLSFLPIFIVNNLLYVKEFTTRLFALITGKIFAFVLFLVFLIVLPIVLIIPDLSGTHFHIMAMILIFTLSYFATIFVLFYKSVIGERL